MKLNPRIAKAAKSTLKHATHMNVIGSMLKKKYGQCPNVEFTLGYMTKTIRRIYNFPKKHFIDAICIAMNCAKDIKLLVEDVIVKACHAKGPYRRTQGRHSQTMRLPIKVGRFRMYDKVERDGEIGYVIGRRSGGSCSVNSIFGIRLDWNVTKRFGRRIQAATSWKIESVYHQYI